MKRRQVPPASGLLVPAVEKTAPKKVVGSRSEVRRHLTSEAMTQLERLVELVFQADTGEGKEVTFEARQKFTEMLLRYGVGQETTMKFDQRGIVEKSIMFIYEWFTARGFEMSQEEWRDFASDWREALED